MRFKIVLLFSLLSSFSFSQIGTGQWRLHVSPRKAIDVAAGDGIILAAFEAGLLEYDVENQEKTSWTTVNALSDVGISALYYDEKDKSFWIGYQNGNIDKLKNNKITNIPAIKLAQIQGMKTVNRFIEHNGVIYVSFGLGILKINPLKNEVIDTYYPNASERPIKQIAFVNDSIFALSDKRVYKASVSNTALADPNQWSLDSRLPDAGVHAYGNIINLNSKLCVSFKNEAYGKDSVFLFSSTGKDVIIGTTDNYEINNIQEIDGKLHLSHEGGGTIYNSSFEMEDVIYTYIFNNICQLNAMVFYKNNYYLADKNHGLVSYLNIGTNAILSLAGPPKNAFYSLSGAKGKIAVTGGVILDAGFTYSLDGAYTFENEEWKLYDKSNQTSWQSVDIWDVSSSSVNPVNVDEMAFGCYSPTPLSVVKDGKQVSELYTELNSPLELSSQGNSNICVSDVKYDEDGNLWVLNCYSNEPLKLMDKAGVWYSFESGSAVKSKYTGRLVVDYNGNQWFGVLGTGLMGYSTKGTFSDPSDDEYVLLNSGESSGALPSTTVTAIAVDFDNEIWIGTNQGFAILYNSASAFGASAGQYNAQRIKLEFEGNVEYLLGNTAITDIEVDGGNRKWIATANTGLFLLSPDGLTIEERFTTENSPLISNSISDIQLNHETGELFIITDVGLVSYRTGATYEDPNYSDVKVFPNPAKPTDTGLITVQGLKYDSDIRVTDAAGNLVYKTTSNGGTAVWDGKDVNGNRVETGVYYFWTASNTNKGRYVAKVLVIK